MITTTIHPDILEDSTLAPIVEHADEILRETLDYSRQLDRIDWSPRRDDKGRQLIDLRLTDIFGESIVDEYAVFELKSETTSRRRFHELWGKMLRGGIEKSLKRAREYTSRIQGPRDA